MVQSLTRNNLKTTQDFTLEGPGRRTFSYLDDGDGDGNGDGLGLDGSRLKSSRELSFSKFEMTGDDSRYRYGLMLVTYPIHHGIPK